MATNTIKYVARYDDHSTRTFTIADVPNSEFVPEKVEAKMNAYNDIWGWQLPDGTSKESVTGYEDYIAAMPEVFISTGGASLVSLESATLIQETEEVIYSG